jgi:hypothetical protein
MRYVDAFLVHHIIAGENQIEIDDAWRTGVGTRAPCVQLDAQKLLKHLTRGRAGPPDTDGIQKCWIVLETGPDRRGLNEGGQVEIRQEPGDLLRRRPNARATIAEIATERNGYTAHVQCSFR